MRPCQTNLYIQAALAGALAQTLRRLVLALGSWCPEWAQRCREQFCSFARLSPKANISKSTLYRHRRQTLYLSCTWCKEKTRFLMQLSPSMTPGRGPYRTSYPMRHLLSVCLRAARRSGRAWHSWYPGNSCPAPQSHEATPKPPNSQNPSCLTSTTLNIQIPWTEVRPEARSTLLRNLQHFHTPSIEGLRAPR